MMLALALAVLAPAIPVPAAADAVSPYEHGRHESQVAAAGAPSIPCVRCHALDRNGRLQGAPGHAACFGDCHGPAPRRRPGVVTPLTPARRRLCTTCHAPAALDQAAARGRGRARLAVSLGDPARAPDYALSLSHARHEGPSRTRRGCLTCHTVPADGAGDGKDTSPDARPRRPATRPDGHARCVPCHAPPGRTLPARTPRPATGQAAGQAPAPMDDCTGCHVPVQAGPATRAGAPHALRPRLVRGPHPARFSHQAHRAHAPLDCAGCHADVARADGNALPAPGMRQCGTCHDGARAFSVTGPHCRRCHTTRTAGQGPRPRRGAAFSHRAHGARGMDMRCSACHTLDARGVPRPPASDHAPCADAGCHRDQFFSRAPTICGACHLGTAPWARLHFDPPPRAETELGARFSHAQHLPGTNATAPAAPEPCTGCHATRTREREMGLPLDHTACTGAGCHVPAKPAAAAVAVAAADAVAVADADADADTDTAANPPVPLDTCEACHQLGLMAARRDQRLHRPWSVRARFRHAPHRTDPRNSAPVACTACHADVARAAGLDDIAGPSKATCAPCHDGSAAFKLTGHGCARCHDPAALGAARPR